MKKIFSSALVVAILTSLSTPVIGSAKTSFGEVLPQISFDSNSIESLHNKGLNIGELGYDFVMVSDPQQVTINHQDAFNQNNPLPAIQFIVQARQFVTPLGYFAYFYDRDGIEVGFVPVEMSPAGGSYQPNQRVRVTIPLILLNPNASIQDIVIRRL